VKSPHTSAGRVPTDLGYRMFVDSMVTVQKITDKDVEAIRKNLSAEGSAKELAVSASGLLSGITSMASIVMLPKRSHKSLRQIEFLPLNENRILSILVVNECEVENRVIQTNRSYTRQELEKIANYLNREFIGRDVASVRTRLLEEMKQARQEVNEFMGALLSMADKLFPEEEAKDDLLVTGKTNLLAYQEMADTEKLRQLFDTFKSKKDVLEILDQSLMADGMQIYIGSESGNNVLEECSIITSPYTVDDEVVGVLGVVGPTRMNYQKVIPVVDITAKIFGSVLQFK
ncbi:MAG: heat-inducible transcriptional repressor HrcA, partial [Gammaproteobacteria bacterium]|nr:heat-inducible transcriptional repressor HrcA [Gammaproteobacteria bacterium]